MCAVCFVAFIVKMLDKLDTVRKKHNFYDLSVKFGR